MHINRTIKDKFARGDIRLIYFKMKRYTRHARHAQVLDDHISASGRTRVLPFPTSDMVPIWRNKSYPARCAREAGVLLDPRRKGVSSSQHMIIDCKLMLCKIESGGYISFKVLL